MKRKIKFRAWVESANKMLDWDSLKEKSDLGSVISRGYRGYHPMQYIGMKDKKGVEIYEGDIVGTYTNEYDTDYDDNPSKWIMVVEWNIEEGKWGIKDIEVITTLEQLYGDSWNEDTIGVGNPSKELKIIGNIYQNPELTGNK